MHDPTHLSRRLRHAPAVAWCAAVFALSFWLFTRNNDGPYWYHPDEQTKAAQILDLPRFREGESGRNFKHPQLLLEATELWVWQAETAQDRQAIVQAGRSVSAIFGAVCVTSLALSAYLAVGWIGLTLTSVAMALCPPLLVAAHHMKEDAALACGIGLAVLATAAWWRTAGSRLGWITLPLLGIAAAVAPSGKYVGAVSMLIAVPALFARWRRWYEIPARFGVFAVFFFGALAGINWRVFQDWESFKESLTWETNHGLSGHGSVTLDVPSGFMIYSTRAQTGVHVQALALAATPLVALHLWRRGRAGYLRDGWMILVILFAVGCTVMLSYGRIPFHRYALPVIVLAHALAGIAGALLVNASAALIHPARWRSAATFGLALAMSVGFVAMQLPACLAFNRGFGDDGRQHLRHWLGENANPFSRLVADHYALLRNRPDPRSPVGQTLPQLRVTDPHEFTRRRGKVIDNLRAAGVRYVIAVDASYERYTLPFSKPVPGEEQQFERMRRFYQTVFAECPLVWSWQPNPPARSFADPEIRVYQVPPR